MNITQRICGKPVYTFLSSSKLVFRTFSYKPKINAQPNIDSSLSITPNLNISKLDSSSIESPITSDTPLGTFMSKVYSNTTLSIGVVFGLGFAAAATGMGVAHPLYTLLAGSALTGLGSAGIIKLKPKISSEFKQKGISRQLWINSIPRNLAFGSILVGSGINLASFIGFVNPINPFIVPVCAAMSMFFMTGASYYATKAQAKFSPIQASAYGSLFALAVMNAVSYGLFFSIGSNPLSEICFGLDPYLGIGLMGIIHTINSKSAAKGFKKGDFDFLKFVAEFLVCNILIKISDFLATIL